MRFLPHLNVSLMQKLTAAYATSLLPEQPEPSHRALEVELEVGSGDWRVPATVRFRNCSSKKTLLYRLNACEEGRIRSDLFVVESSDGEIDYQGPYARRREPQMPDDFIELGPGEVYEANVFLAEAYAFPSGAGRYTARFEALDPTAPPDAPQVLRSQPARFELTA